MILQKAIFINRAPFTRLELDLSGTTVTVLSGINGAGKTTILSYIADAFYEMAKKTFQNEYEGKNNKYYRVSSDIYCIDNSIPSVVYLRFIYHEKIMDYIDIRNCSSEEIYRRLIPLDGAIHYSEISRQLTESQNAKFSNVKPEDRLAIFGNSIMIYFPAYRYEQPGYLNDPYKIALSFSTKPSFTGYLKNQIEVTTDLPKITDWIMDVILDTKLYNNLANSVDLQGQLNSLLTYILESKAHGPVRLGIGPRHTSGTRIQIMRNDSTQNQLYPSIFNMSSGELALLCVFGELLKQSDVINKKCIDVTGIVLIDEIDKHLHIKLQKEVLPKLLLFFPNLQFIVSSHAPFLNLGLADNDSIKAQIFDLDNGGCACSARKNHLYEEVYTMMIDENRQFAKKYEALLAVTQLKSIPLIITEGKSDCMHLKAAQKALKLDSLSVDYYVHEEDFGQSNLYDLLQKLSKVPQKRVTIGIFDRDCDVICKKIGALDASFVDLSNNVFAMILPLVNSDIYGEKISIEHYYPYRNLTKQDDNCRRLFLGSEFYASGNSTNGEFQTKIKNIQHKVEVNGVIDDKVFRRSDLKQRESCALSKNDFAELVLNRPEYTSDFDFSNFRKIFEIIERICEIKGLMNTE